MTNRGFRRLVLDGYAFGEMKVYKGSTSWRCTANLRDERNKSKRCSVSLMTKVINGYEMIRTVPRLAHEHPTKTHR